MKRFLNPGVHLLSRTWPWKQVPKSDVSQKRTSAEPGELIRLELPFPKT